jgi:hypothetical protein
MEEIAKATKAGVQRQATALVHNSKHQQLLQRYRREAQNAAASPAKRKSAKQAIVRMHSTSSPGSMAWVRASGNTPQTTLTPVQYNIAASLALGRDLPAVVEAGPMCPAASRGCPAASDGKGYHLLGCRHGREVIIRHDMVRDTLGAFMRSAGWRVKTEALLGDVGVGGDVGSQRMDLVFMPPRAGQWEFVDVAIVQPTSDSYVNMAEAREGAETGGILRAERRKNKTYQAAIEQGFRLTPFIGEAFGRWSDGARQLVRRIAKDAATQPGFDEDRLLETRLVDKMWQELACALQKGNALILASRSRKQGGGVEERGRYAEPLGAAYMPEFRG